MSKKQPAKKTEAKTEAAPAKKTTKRQLVDPGKLTFASKVSLITSDRDGREGPKTELLKATPKTPLTIKELAKLCAELPGLKEADRVLAYCHPLVRYGKLRLHGASKGE
jgi:hypothetical protein